MDGTVDCGANDINSICDLTWCYDDLMGEEIPY